MFSPSQIQCDKLFPSSVYNIFFYVYDLFHFPPSLHLCSYEGDLGAATLERTLVIRSHCDPDLSDHHIHISVEISLEGEEGCVARATVSCAK